MIAHAIGTFQARVLLTVFYLVIAAPFALVVKLSRDPLRLRRPRGDGFWVERAPADRPADAGRRQY